MGNQINIVPVDPIYRDAIISLLRSEKLPVSDLPPDLPQFLMAIDNGHVVGGIGLEIYERNGLLRSLVVKPEYRSMKIAAGLISELEKLARDQGLHAIYLLTETAPDYFLKKGYDIIPRSDAPESLQQSSEFSHVCPTTAVLMRKNLH
jgi:amino-acid N-acetyltransferase